MRARALFCIGSPKVYSVADLSVGNFEAAMIVHGGLCLSKTPQLPRFLGPVGADTCFDKK